MKIGILKRATDAKELTGVAQIQEEISIAWNGVQVDGITKGWDNSTKANALNTELLKEDGNASASWNTTNNVIDVTYKGYETTINPDTGSMTALAKAGAGAGGFGSEENGEIDWENIIATAQKHSDQSDSNGDIGIDANGNACNLDLWLYDYGGDEVWLGDYGTSDENPTCYLPFHPDYKDLPVCKNAEKVNVVCPQYIKFEGENEFLEVKTLRNSAFIGCSSLQTIVLPSHLVEIDRSVFQKLFFFEKNKTTRHIRKIGWRRQL